MPKILIVEDEPAIFCLITVNLTGAHHTCEQIADGNDATEAIDHFSLNLILLDVMFPGADKFELLGYIQPLNIPTIILTAVDDTQSKVRGLQQGADDYITKPFELVKLLARVEAVFQRAGKLQSQWIQDAIWVDYTSRRVTKDGKEIQLVLTLSNLYYKTYVIYRKKYYELTIKLSAKIQLSTHIFDVIKDTPIRIKIIPVIFCSIKASPKNLCVIPNVQI